MAPPRHDFAKTKAPRLDAKPKGRTRWDSCTTAPKLRPAERRPNVGRRLTSASWRFGLLCSQTGVTSKVETTQLNVSLLAIEQLNRAGGVAGRPIEPIICNPASNPKQFATLAERLLSQRHARLVFGCCMSSTRKAVLPLVEAYRGLLFYPTLYEGFEYSKHCIYTGAAPNQNLMQLGR